MLGSKAPVAGTPSLAPKAGSESTVRYMARADMEAAATLAGVTLEASTSVSVRGADPILKSPMPIGLGAATVLFLIGQEVDRIWQLRGGRQQHLSLDARHATVSLRSYAFNLLDGEPANANRTTSNLTRFWATADDRHIFLHESFNDVSGILAELSLDPNGASTEDIAAAVSKRNAFELEDVLADKGLCSAVCRSRQEWLRHGQGSALASTYPLRVTRIGDAPPAALLVGDRPLSGIRMLDLTRVLAGPVCGRVLAEHGADVLHITAQTLPTFKAFEIDTGHGKRQAFLDLNVQADKQRLNELIEGADVFCQSYRPLSMARRGFGPLDLARRRPGIVYVSESAFGSAGPWSTRPGWEQLAQTATGVAHLHGGAAPLLAPAAVCDYTTGYFAALGTLIALRKRATEGGSWLVEVSLARTAMWYLELMDALSEPLDPARRSGEGERSAFMMERQTGFGLVRHVAPPLRMSDTPPSWVLPTAPLGSGSAEWLKVEP